MSVVAACGTACNTSSPAPSASPPSSPGVAEERQFLLERVDDAAVVQVYADGFSALPPREKVLVWHLYQAAIAGRDIFYDQKHELALEMRDILEAIVSTRASGASASPAEQDTDAEILRYTKLFWINNGPYNNLTARKFVLQCDPEAFAAAARKAVAAGGRIPLASGETLDDRLARLRPMFFDPDFDPMVTSKTPPPSRDILTASANNLYDGVSMADLEGFTERHPLNSRLVKRDGRLVEEVYRADGRYGRPIAAIIRHLEAAIPYATPPMAEALRALVTFYRTGDTRDRVAYDIAWVEDDDSPVDTINGFIEVYLDARGVKGAWEGLVFYVHPEKTAEIRKIAANAQWFEDHMPWDPVYRKPDVQGIVASAIEIVVETGDSGPVSPIGINLPNDQGVRERYGSKSVSLSNVSEAFDRSTPESFRNEFAWTPEAAARAGRWAAFARELSTNMHEVIGHASGRIAERLRGQPQAALREQYSALEEARADLVALYFLPDPKLVELGILAQEDQEEIVLAGYEAYTQRALDQLRRVRQGTQIADDHMRNRQMIVHWLMANTPAVEKRQRDGKTYYVMTDAAAFREGVGRLLAEVQRIKAEGDYPAAKRLFDAYGIDFDPALRDEIVARVDALNLPSYTGFVMPKLEPVIGPGGEIVDATISYPRDLVAQMLEYSAATRELRP
jgi:dipeptidyl-peptidase-3